jgi:hypothetical protein
MGFLAGNILCIPDPEPAFLPEVSTHNLLCHFYTSPLFCARGAVCMGINYRRTYFFSTINFVSVLCGAKDEDLYPLQVASDCIQRKTWCMAPFAGVDYNSPYLKVNFVASYPLPLRGRGKVGKISPIYRAHLYLSANFQKTNSKRKRMEKEREGMRVDLMSLNRHFMRIDMLELTLKVPSGQIGST